MLRCALFSVLALAGLVLLYTVAADVLFLARAADRTRLQSDVQRAHRRLALQRTDSSSLSSSPPPEIESDVWRRLPSCHVPASGAALDELVFNVTRFLPQPVDDDDGVPDDPLRTRLQGELAALQLDSTRCSVESSVLVSRLPGYGLSAQLLYQPRLLSWTVGRGLTTVAEGRVAGADAANRSLCEAADVSCVYEPWSACSLQDVPPDAVRSHPVSEPFKAEHPMFSLPAAYRARGWFWWAAQTLEWVTRPNERLRAMVADAKRRLRWQHPMIVMHVRRSDSCRTRATCQPLSAYFDAAREMSARYGPLRNVYVATDGSEVIAELKSGNYSREFDVRWLDWDRSGFDWMRDPASGHVWLEPCHEKGICDGIADMFSMALDYELIADADFHIGLHTSGAFRLPFALSYARKGCVVPFVSLDIPWCNHWGTVMDWHGYHNIMC